MSKLELEIKVLSCISNIKHDFEFDGKKFWCFTCQYGAKMEIKKK